MVAAKKIGTLLITAFVIFLAGCAGGGESKNSQQLNTYAALEREVFSEINLARTRPLGYAKILEERRQHFSGKVYYKPGMKYQLRTFEGVFAVDDAIRALKRQRPLNPLNLSKGMTKAARDHVDDMGTNGLIGHTGSDGSKFTERLSRYGSGSFSVRISVMVKAKAARSLFSNLLMMAYKVVATEKISTTKVTPGWALPADPIRSIEPRVSSILRRIIAKRGSCWWFLLDVGAGKH